MWGLTLITVLLGTFYSPALGDTRALYQLLPLTQTISSQPQIDRISEAFQSITAIAAPRLGTALWNPFEYFTWDAVLQPAATVIGFLVAVLGFVQITDFLLHLISSTKKRQAEKRKPEETNEIDETRRKRMISPEETQKVVESIEKGERRFGA